MRTAIVSTLIVLSAACGGGAPETQPAPTNFTASPAQLDSLLGNAQALLAARDWDKAAIAYERLLLELPRGDRRLPAARLALGESRMGLKSYLQAVREFRRTADEYPTDSLAPMGLLRAGDAYAELWRRPELDPTYGIQALATFQELLTRYPESATAVTGRERVAGLNEWFALKEFKNGNFYLRYKAYDSAILVFKDLVAKYPRTSIAPQALEELVSAYRRLGYVEDVEEMCGYFRTNYPDSSRLATTCPQTLATPPAGTSPGD